MVQLVRKKPKQPVAEHLKSGTGGSTRDTKTVSKGGKVQPAPLMSTNVPPHIANSVNRASPRFSNARASPKGGGGGGHDQFRSRTYSEGVRTPVRGERMRQRDEDCFGQGGSALNEEEKRLIEEDFDFEKNLAMFDKDFVMKEIDAELANKPDIVRLVHCNRWVYCIK